VNINFNIRKNAEDEAREFLHHNPFPTDIQWGVGLDCNTFINFQQKLAEIFGSWWERYDLERDILLKAILNSVQYQDEIEKQFITKMLSHRIDPLSHSREILNYRIQHKHNPKKTLKKIESVAKKIRTEIEQNEQTSLKNLHAINYFHAKIKTLRRLL